MNQDQRSLAEALPERHQIQWARKFWHVFVCLSVVSLLLFFQQIPLSSKLLFYGGGIILLVISDLIRLYNSRFNAWACKNFKSVMRKDETKTLNSSTYFGISTLLVSIFFPIPIAVLAILYLGFGDCLASIVGIKWGRHKLLNQFTWEGSITFFVTCFLITFLYPFLDSSFHASIWLFAFIGGFIGMCSEWVSGRLDDNLVIPICSAVFLKLSLLLLT